MTVAPCACDAPGWCKRHRRDKNELKWLACKRDDRLRWHWDEQAKVGLGDVLAAIIRVLSLGIATPARVGRWVRRLTGGRKCCGCERRKRWLNRWKW
jgi:hypothetical protein